jgi:hypothetical protein
MYCRSNGSSDFEKDNKGSTLFCRKPFIFNIVKLTFRVEIEIIVNYTEFPVTNFTEKYFC